MPFRPAGRPRGRAVTQGAVTWGAVTGAAVTGGATGHDLAACVAIANAAADAAGAIIRPYFRGGLTAAS